MHIVITADGTPKVRTTQSDRERFRRVEAELKTLADHATTLCLEFREAEEALAAVNAIWEHVEREKHAKPGRSNPTNGESAGTAGDSDSAGAIIHDSGAISEDVVDGDATGVEPEAP